MFFIISKLLAFLIKPHFWIFVLLVLSLIFKKYRKKLIILCISIFYLLSNSFILDGISRIWEVDPVNIKNINKKYDVAIVLGGFSSYNKDLERIEYNESGDRLFSAIQLYQKGIVKKILISGGNGQLMNNEYKESLETKKYLISHGIPKKDIITEHKSRNTKENAKFSAEILKKKYPNGKFILITSAWHMKRALLCFKRNNITIDGFATDCTPRKRNIDIEYLLIPNSKIILRWETLIKEWVGYCVYFLFV